MSDSVAALWASELLRARHWLVSSGKDKQQENEQLFQRVKMHMDFKDHQRSLQSAEVVSEDENDMALDFLGDVDVSDMDALLQAEAAKATAAMEPTETSLPSTRDLMMPLAMPMDLVVAPKVKLQPVAISELDPKQWVAGVTLGNEAGVHELMQELALDVTQLKPLEIEECKTEESTPPHVLKNFGEQNTTTSDGSEQFNYMRDIASKSPRAPHEKKAEASATMQHDDVAKEMLSWVSGYRDPEVIRCKENLQRKRNHTLRYEAASGKEHRRASLQVKKSTRDNNDDSDSDSDDSMSSDYTPTEDDEMSELDENEVIVLLSDDCLDSEEERQPVKLKRKRLRQADDILKKKKSRSRKPIVTRKLTQQSCAIQNTNNFQVANVTESEAKLVLATAVVEANSTNTPDRPVELLSSEKVGESTGKGGGSTGKESMSKVVEHMSTNSHGLAGISSNARELEKAMELTILRDCIQKESDASRLQQKRGPERELTVAAPLLAESKAVSDDLVCELVSSDSVALEPNIRVDDSTANEKADTADADLSDTGTIHWEDEEMSFQNEHFHEEIVASTTTAVIDSGNTAELEDVKKVDRLLDGDLKQSVESDTEDVSEAETEILEDDEPSTDDLGLNNSDDSDIGSRKQANLKNDSVDAQRDASGGKESGTEFETKPTPERHTSADRKQELLTNQKEDNASTLTSEVQRFFDFMPLKLKPKVKVASSTALKPLPLHSCTLTHSKVGNSNAEDAFANSKKTQIVLTTPSIGSNGLRPMKRPIATSTTRKGKYLVTRRCTKMLDDVPEIQKQSKRQYTMVITKNSKSNDTNDQDDEPLAILAKELSNNSEDTPQTRYLSYAGAMISEEPPSSVANTPRNVSKSRFGGGGVHFSPSTELIVSALSSDQDSQLPDKDIFTGGYRREPQISIYDALHLDREESIIETCKVTGFKRPSRFKKMQEEAVRNGTPMVKSQLQDKDWDKMPIPKKKKQIHQVNDDVLVQPSKVSDVGGKSRKERCKKTVTSSMKKSGSSYYGPQASEVVRSGKHDSSSRGRHGRERNNFRREDNRKKKRSPSLPLRDRDHYDKKYRVRDDRGRKGSSRSRSRSLSPHRRDDSNNRKRCRSRSWSQEKSSDRDHRRSDRTSSISRDRVRYSENNGKRRSFSPKKHNSSKKKTPGDLPKLDEACHNGKIEDIVSSAKKQKFFHSTVAPPSPGISATFDDGDDNVFISDSDDDENAMIKEVEDIRFDLDSISVDEALMTRQVYVTGLNPTVCAEQIEEDFARFGVGVDLETGFPSIEVFACQRNYLGRGDARVTFKTEEGAQEAVEELNLKNVKNSMIHVRRMDVHTQRILTTQFQAVRDTWKCTKTQCRADVSVWNAKCDKCGRKRVYGPSNIKIGAGSWLCSLCFTSNESFATSCCGCMEALPEIVRSTFYTSCPDQVYQTHTHTSHKIGTTYSGK